MALSASFLGSFHYRWVELIRFVAHGGGGRPPLFGLVNVEGDSDVGADVVYSLDSVEVINH